jgi:MFS family permease
MKWNRSFLLLLSGQSLANLADSLYIVAVVSVIYNVSGSTLQAAMVPVFRVSGMILGGLIAPLLFRRWRLLSMLTVSQLMQTLLLGGIAAASFLPPGTGQILLLALVAAAAIFDGWTGPARNSLVPRLVPGEQLVKANGMLATSDQAVLLTGWSLGGLLVDLLGSPKVLAITLVCMALSTLSLLFVRDPVKERPDPGKPSLSLKDTMEGWRILFSHPLLGRLAASDSFQFVADGAWTGAVILAFVHEVLYEDNTWWGFINASYFAGAILGGLLVSRWSGLVQNRLAGALLLGSLSMCVLTAMFALIPVPAISLALCLLMGVPYQMRQIAGRTLLQSTPAPEQTPLVLTAHNTLNAAFFAISAFLMGWVTDHFSAQSAYGLSAALCAAAGSFALALRKRAGTAGGAPSRQ